jgi:cytochrome b6-f complex iron-sulfur subunit
MTTLAVSVAGFAVAVVVGLLVLFLLLLIASFLRARRAAKAAPAPAAAPAGAPAAAAPKARPVLSRRDFFRGGLLASLGVFAAQFGAASIAFLWPNIKGGFGSVIEAGTVSDIKATIEETQQPFYYGAGRFYIISYDGDGTDTIYAGIAQDGLMSLYQKCVHLGCRVPFCQQSQWFECPCHGSKYNHAGEYRLGPAPRGMDRFSMIIDGDVVKVDTSKILLGPPRGTDTIDQPPEGPFCVGV